jgi:hypothetical protein
MSNTVALDASGDEGREPSRGVRGKKEFKSKSLRKINATQNP